MIANLRRFFDRCRVAGDEPIVGLCTDAVDDSARQFPLRAIGVFDLDELKLQSRAAAVQYENLHNAHPSCFILSSRQTDFHRMPLCSQKLRRRRPTLRPMTSVPTMQQDFSSLPLRPAKAALESS